MNMSLLKELGGLRIPRCYKYSAPTELSSKKQLAEEKLVRGANQKVCN